MFSLHFVIVVFVFDIPCTSLLLIFAFNSMLLSKIFSFLMTPNLTVGFHFNDLGGLNKTTGNYTRLKRAKSSTALTTEVPCATSGGDGSQGSSKIESTSGDIVSSKHSNFKKHRIYAVYIFDYFCMRFAHVCLYFVFCALIDLLVQQRRSES